MAIDSKRVKEIFLEAADLSDEAARAAYLDKACGADAGVRERVEALLRCHDPEGSFLGTPAAVVPDPDQGATQALPGARVAGVAPAQTTGGDNDASPDEPLTFLTPSPRPDALGRLGHYEVLQVLGKGGFGIVFRAFDEILQRVVALKVLAPQIAATSPARRRFLREARSSAQVRHENVVQVYEVAEQPLPYLAMEFIPGETLQQKLDRVGPLDVPEVLRVGRQIAEGLAAAHATDLIHRDIKPGNVLLEGGQHKVKITDFGLARAADDASISQSGIIAGTPMYMAPEQAEGQTLDQRADLFSLGSVLYQMVAGRPPFRANTTVAVLKRVAEDKPRAIREIIPETPQWLCDIIAKLHAKNPDDRYQSAREVADVLADCEAQLKASSKLKDYSRIPSSKPPRSGGRNWAAVAAVALLPVIALAVTEFTGVTHLFLGQAPLDPGKPGGDPPLVVVAKHETPVPVAKPQLLPPTFKNSIGMEFVIVPKGKSWLGGGKDKPGDKEVVIPADFYLGKYEVTQEEWEKVMGENPSQFSRTRGGKDAVRHVPDAELKRFPVDNVSWDQCQVFVAKLNALEKEAGWVYRLPKLTEWEYACRGGPMADKAESAFDYYLAKPTNTLLATQANIGMDSELNRPCKVGTYEPNRLGLYDMHGNVWEWCRDEVPGDPKDPKAASRRVRRGGSWNTDSGACRAVDRHAYPPSHRDPTLGLRLARVPSGAASPEAKTPPLAVAPFADADIQRIAALPAAEQVEEVRKELMRRNPGFDGKFEHKIEGGMVTVFRIVTDQVTDIAPIRVWNALRVLKCAGSSWRSGQLADLTPLVGVNLASLTNLDLGNTKVADAAMVYFKDRKNLTKLNLGNTKVTDAGLIYFKDCERLTWLALNGTKVSDAGLAYFKGVRLTGLLQIEGTGITDVTPLHGMPLEGIRLTPKNITRGLDILRDMKSLKTIGLDWNQAWPAAEFWERYDKGEFGKAAAPFTDADVQRIAALPAAEQVEEVRKELMRRNPGFDGKFEHKIEGDVVTEFRIVTDQVTDIAPIRVWSALRTLDCTGTVTNGKHKGQLEDLTPLTGMNLAGLKALRLAGTNVGDAELAHFKDCKNLTDLALNHTNVGDAGLTHFKDCKKLRILNLGGTRVSNVGLAHFKDCENLWSLTLFHTQVSDVGLAHFKDCKNLTNLHLAGAAQVSDAGLAHFKGMPLKFLLIYGTGVTDLTTLQGMPLEDIRLAPKNITRGLDLLRDMKSLKTIGTSGVYFWPAVEFWQRYDKGEFGKAFTDADVKRIAALPAAEQVEEVRKELKRLNPGFDGKFGHKIEDGVVTEFSIVTDQVTDIAPIRVWNALRVLNCGGNSQHKGLLADLSPLKGMNLAGLTFLNLCNTKVTDAGLAHFKDCKNLRTLNLNNTQVTDAGLIHFKDCKGLLWLGLGPTKLSDAGLAYFKDCKGLNFLTLSGTKVSDAGLAYFKGVPLKRLQIEGTGITDLTPLQGMPLENIILTPKNITRGLDSLRDMKSLKTISIGWKQDWPAAEFWQRYDKGEFGKAADNRDPDRRAAEYVLSIGGTVRADGADRDIRAVAELPQGPFRLTVVLLNQNKQVTDAGLAAFEGCKNVTELRLYYCAQVTDAGLSHFKDCKGLTILRLEGVSVTDAGLANFKDYKNLENLQLGAGQPKLTDAGLAYLKDCKNLKILHLFVCTRVTDAGLAHLKHCKQLTLLDLRGTRVTDAGLANFKDCKDLTTLWLEGTPITDTGLAVFKDCKDMKDLDLARTSIRDEGLAHLKGHQKLAILGLGGTSVTDAGLAHLADLKGLTSLALTGTKVSDRGLAHLKGMPLNALQIYNTGITDLTPLQGMPLKDIRLTPKNIAKGLDILRDMKSLKTIGITWQQGWPAAEFWQRYDKGEFKE